MPQVKLVQPIEACATREVGTTVEAGTASIAWKFLKDAVEISIDETSVAWADKSACEPK